jgi:hypothetical protein
VCTGFITPAPFVQVQLHFLHHWCCPDLDRAFSTLFSTDQGRGKDGHIYTLVRHSLFGCCVELWHDSVGALHLVVPDSRQGKGMAYTTHCVFSTGITTMEDDCCAPDLLRQLVELSSAPEGRDNNALRVPEGGITAYSSGGELTWTVRQRAASELAGTKKMAQKRTCEINAASHALISSRILTREAT